MGKPDKALPTGWTTSPREALRVTNTGPIAQYDAASTPGYTGDKQAGTAALIERGAHLADLQEMLFANGRSRGHRSVLLVVQGMDTAGKGGIVRHVGGLFPRPGRSGSSTAATTRTCCRSACTTWYRSECGHSATI